MSENKENPAAQESTFKKYTFNFDNNLRAQLELIGKRDGRNLASVLERAIMLYIGLHDANGDEIYNIKQVIQKGALDGIPLMPHSAQRMCIGSPITTPALEDNGANKVAVTSKPNNISNSDEAEVKTATNETAATGETVENKQSIELGATRTKANKGKFRKKS